MMDGNGPDIIPRLKHDGSQKAISNAFAVKSKEVAEWWKVEKHSKEITHVFNNCNDKLTTKFLELRAILVRVPTLAPFSVLSHLSPPIS